MKVAGKGKCTSQAPFGICGCRRKIPEQLGRVGFGAVYFENISRGVEKEQHRGVEIPAPIKQIPVKDTVDASGLLICEKNRERNRIAASELSYGLRVGV